jgi:hypothetical protein
MTVKRKSSGNARRWSARVTRESDALDLESAVFKKRSAKEIARSLKRSAERSDRRKSPPLRSAMSMLTFYMNRAGESLPPARAKVLTNAKDELRKLYGRPAKAAAKSKAGKSRNYGAPAKRLTKKAKKVKQK